MRRFISRVRNTSNLSILLVGIVLFVFVFPLFKTTGGKGHLLVPVSYTLMLMSVSAIINPKKILFFVLIGLAVLFQWFVFIFNPADFPIFSYLAFAFSLIVFSLATYIMIVQIISSKEVDTSLVLQSVLAYLLIGVILVLVNVLIVSVNPGAIGFATNNPGFDEIIYYSFVTYTTIGFGDISPVSSAARVVAIAFGLIGQLYLTIIIAFIVGKFLNKQS
jgi:hypothetical protein